MFNKKTFDYEYKDEYQENAVLCLANIGKHNNLCTAQTLQTRTPPHGYYRPIVTTVVTRPAVITHISNRLSKKDRLEMALAYLKGNKSLSISKYSKMTGLTNAMAEAELDAFSVNKNNPIRMVKDGKKKLYVV